MMHKLLFVLIIMLILVSCSILRSNKGLLYKCCQTNAEITLLIENYYNTDIWYPYLAPRKDSLRFLNEDAYIIKNDTIIILQNYNYEKINNIIMTGPLINISYSGKYEEKLKIKYLLDLKLKYLRYKLRVFKDDKPIFVDTTLNIKSCKFVE